MQRVLSQVTRPRKFNHGQTEREGRPKANSKSISKLSNNSPAKTAKEHTSETSNENHSTPEKKLD
jgi:hypothetical protein